MSKRKYNVTLLKDHGFKSQLQKVEKTYIQLNAQFVVKCLAFQIWVKVHRQIIWKAKNIWNGYQQSIYFSKSESIDLSALSEGSNNHLSAYSTSSISKSLFD